MKKLPTVSMNIVDHVVGFFDPRAKVMRLKSRMALAFAEDSGYITPNSNRKAMKGVAARDRSPNQDTAPKIQSSRALSRELYMTTPVMVAALRRMNDNVVGVGLQPQPTPDASFLGMDTATATDWVRHTQREFDLWAGSVFASSSATLTFWDMQPLVLLSALMNGDSFYALPWKQPRDKKHPYELRMKLIEADLVRNPMESGYETGVPLPEGPDIIGGVEFKGGELDGYHVADNYLSEAHYQTKKNFRYIPAWDEKGRRQMIQVFDPERIGQRRGMPIFASVLETMKQLSRLSESELMSALVSSFFTVFVKDVSGLGATLPEGYTPAEVSNGGGGTGPDAEQQPKNADSAYDLDMGYGNVHYLDDDKEIQIADPKRTDEGFVNFFDALVTQIGASAGIAKSQLMIQFTASYSAARGEILETWKMYRRRRAWFTRSFCQMAYEALLEEAIIKGRIKAPGFLTDPAKRAAWSACNWVGPGMGQLDPLKEANASVVKIKNGLATYEEEYTADRGGSWYGAMERRSRENDHLQRVGLPDPTLTPTVVPDPNDLTNPVTPIQK